MAEVKPSYRFREGSAPHLDAYLDGMKSRALALRQKANDYMNQARTMVTQADTIDRERENLDTDLIEVQEPMAGAVQAVAT